MNKVDQVPHLIEFPLRPLLWKTSFNESFFIRRFDKNSCDPTIVEVMHEHPEVQAQMDTTKDVKDPRLKRSDTTAFLERGEDQKENPIALYAVTDDEGEVIGWIEYYKDEEHPLPANISNNLSLQPEDLILQVSYEKLFSEGWPDDVLNQHLELREFLLKNDRKGVIVSGLRQTMLDLRRKENHISLETNYDPRRIVIYAYTDLDNPASEGVLIKNGFTLDDKEHDYDGESNHLWYKELKDTEPSIKVT